MQFGRYYEEFEVGAVCEHWPGKTVTEYDDHLFCLLTMDHHPLHLGTIESRSEDGRGVVHGETTGYEQDGRVVCTFRREVMVPERSHGQARGGEQPGRPEPVRR